MCFYFHRCDGVNWLISWSNKLQSVGGNRNSRRYVFWEKFWRNLAVEAIQVAINPLSAARTVEFRQLFLLPLPGALLLLRERERMGWMRSVRAAIIAGILFPQMASHPARYREVRTRHGVKVLFHGVLYGLSIAYCSPEGSITRKKS